MNALSIVPFLSHNLKQMGDDYNFRRAVCIGSPDEEFHEEHEQRRQAENDATIYEQHDGGGKNRDDAANDAHIDEKHETKYDDA